MSSPPQNFGERDPPPLEMYPCPKKQRPFFKETKDFISKNEIRTDLNVEI